ncbi:MAG TPA: glycoside hydrolase family 3 N-terminal domain-containing protein [Solirubrobacteraceae bacterium]
MSDLMSRMTLREKVGQMDQIVVGKLRDKTNPASGDCNGDNTTTLQPNCLQRVLVDYDVGSILSGGTDNPPGNTGRDWADLYNAVQHYAIDHSRLHIPIVYGVDAVHGFGHPTDAVLVPHEIGLGASWDPALARRAGALVRRQLKAVGTVWDFAPVQDVARDNRWGRYYETWSEDKLLAGTLGAANIIGMQHARGDRLAVAATVKHFAAYGSSVNGHDRVQAEIPIRYLQDTFLPSYKAAIDAGAATAMTQDGSINHIPAEASHFLQTTELRRRLGFRGVLVSDYQNVFHLRDNYHTASTIAEAAAQLINAGVDMSMTPLDYAAFTDGVIQDVQDGSISRARIDQAVRRILTLKFRLGLFDHPFVNAANANAAVTSGQDVARQASRESIVLLRNQGNVLPLSRSIGKVVVTGPNADNVSRQLGGWSVSWQGAFSATDSQPCCRGPADQIPPAVTVLDGIENAIGASHVVDAPDQASAVAAMASADAAVVVVGEKAYAEVLGDRPLPRLDPDQQALISALEATGKPVIVVVEAGRPLGLGPGDSADAVLMAWQGGTQTGDAVADVLFGSYNPSGRLSVTWPSDDQGPWTTNFNPGGPSPAGDRPKFYDQLPGDYSGQGSGYNPTYPIGFGRSYTTFAESNLSAPASVSRNGSMSALVTVMNTGSRAGVDIVQLYAEQPVTHSVIVAPPRRLVGFKRVKLAAGQSKVVRIPVALGALARTPGDIESYARPRVQPGDYVLHVGFSGGPSAPFTITR